MASWAMFAGFGLLFSPSFGVQVMILQEEFALTLGSFVNLLGQGALTQE